MLIKDWLSQESAIFVQTMHWSTTYGWYIRAFTISLPYQDLGKNRYLLMYKTDFLKENFQNTAIYDQQDHLKIWPKYAKIANLRFKIFKWFCWSYTARL